MLSRLVLAFVFALPPFLSLVARSVDAEPSFTLLVRMSSSASSILQVFDDTGEGYRAEQTVWTGTLASTSPQDYRIPLKPGVYKGLRIDPATSPGTYTIERVAVLDATGRIYHSIPLEDLVPTFHLSVASTSADKVVFVSTGNDPQITYTPAEPLRVRPEARSIPVLAQTFGLYVAIGFAVVWVVQLAAGRWAPSVSKGLEALTRAAEAQPYMAVLIAALVATAIAMHPVLLFGRSLVSANTGGVAMLYDQPPFTPGSSDIYVESARGTDIGAMMWAFVPYSSIQRRALAEGEWPLWNRYNGPGVALWGQGQSLLLDPLHWLTLVGADPAPGWDLKFAAHRLVFTSGIGVATFLITKAWLPATVAAISAPFIGHFAYRLNHPGAFAVTYAPWALVGWFLLVQAETNRRRAGASLLLALASALMVVSSPPKEGIVTLAITEVAGLASLFLHLGVGRALFRGLAFAAAAGAAAALLTAPHWLMFLDTLRASMTFYDSPGASFADGTFTRAMILGPLRDGMPLPGLHALSFVLILAAVIAPIRLASQPLALACLLGGALPIAVAYGIVPAPWLMHIPFVRNIHSIHLTFMAAALVPLLLLSGSGAAVLLSASRGRIVAITIAVAAASAWVFSDGGALGDLSRFGAWPALAVLSGAVLLPTTVLTARRMFPRVLSTMATVALAVLLLAPGSEHLETGITPLDQLLVQPRTRAPVAATSPIIDRIHDQQRDPARTLGLGYLLLPGTHALYGLEAVGGPDALFLRTTDELMKAAGGLLQLGWIFVFHSADLPVQAPVLDMLNVGYLLAQADEARLTGGEQALFAPDRLAAIRRPTSWPRAFFTDRVGLYGEAPELIAQARSAGEPLAAIQRADTDAVRLTQDLVAGTGVVVAGHEYVLTTNTTSFRIRAPRAGIAVLAESYMPDDFVATVNGQTVPYFRVNHAFKGVVIPGAGEWSVRFEYRPRRWGLALAAASLGAVMLTGLAVIALRRPTRARHGARTDSVST